MISAMMWLIAGGFEIVKISLRVFSEVFGVGLKMALVVAALASVPLQAHAAVFDVTTVDGMVINGTLDLNLPPDYRDTVFKNSNFSPTVPGAQTHMLTLDTTTLTGILESQLGALGAHEKYQINSATFTAGVAGTDQTRYLGGNDGTVHALTTAFNVDTATFNNSDTGVSWASGSLSSADYGVAITTGVQGADDTVYSGLGSTLQGWVDGGSNLGLVFETSTVVLGPTAWTDDVSIKLTIDAEIIDDNAPPVVITPPPGSELLVDNFDSNTLEASGFLQNDLGDGKWHHAGAWSVVDGKLTADGDTDVAAESEGALLRAAAVGAAEGTRLTLTFDYTLAAAGESLSVFLYGTKIEAGFNTAGTGRMANHGHAAHGGTGRFQYLETEQDNTLVSSVEFVGGQTVSESPPSSYFGDPSAGGAQYTYFAKITGGMSGTFSQTVDLGQWGLSVTKFDYINVVFARDAGWIGSDDRQREPGRQLHHLGQ